MKQFLITTFVIALSGMLQAQLNLDWMHNVKSSKYSHLMDFFQDNEDGSIYLAYSAKGEVDVPEYALDIDSDQTQTSLIKMSGEGEFLWKTTLISKATRIVSIIKNKSGNIVATGNAEGTSTLESPYGSTQINTTSDCFLFVLICSPSGEVLQFNTVDQTEGRRYIHPKSIALSSKDEIYISLNYYSRLSVQGAVLASTAQGQEYSSVMKFTPKGAFVEELLQWELIGTRTQAEVLIDSKDRVVISGYSRGSVKLSDEIEIKCSEGGVYDTNTSNTFVAQYSKNHELLWHQQIGGRNNQIISDLVMGPEDAIYFCGTFTFECIFSNAVPQLNTSYNRRFEGSLFYAKLSQEGDLEFVKYHRSKGGNSCISGSMAIDDKGLIHLTGSYDGKISFNSSLEARIGSVLEANPKPSGQWHVNTRGNSAWFYSIWHEDNNLYLQNLVDLNGFPNAQYARNISAKNGKLLVGGFYHIGKPSVITPPDNYELQASDDSGMNSLFLSMTYYEHDYYSEYVREEIDGLEPEEEAPIFYDTSDIEEEEQEEEQEEDGMIGASPLAPIEGFSVENEGEPEQEVSKQEVNIYPNPVSDFLTIDLSNFSSWVDLTLHSENGSVVYSQSISYVNQQEKLRINLSGLASGTYYLRVSSEGYSKGYPVIKVR